jgi:hypothetical protein
MRGRQLTVGLLWAMRSGQKVTSTRSSSADETWEHDCDDDGGEENNDANMTLNGGRAAERSRWNAHFA